MHACRSTLEDPTCRSPEAGGFTPSDFPLAGLDQAALDRLCEDGERRGVEDLYPLAPLQEGILFHSLYSPGADLYLEQLTAELAGPLDPPAFAAAWQQVVDRHAALRTAFLWQGLERPLQLVRRQAELPWRREDWRALSAADVAARWRQLLAADQARGFDLARPPLMRLALVRTGEERHRLLWTVHHLLFDGWGFPRILSEFFALYRAAVAGGVPQLGPVHPYRDFIAWLARRDEAASERFWRDALRGFSVPTAVPFDRPNAGSRGARADDYFERTLSLPAPRTAALAALAQGLRVTLNTVVQGAWAVLLSRAAQAADVVFGAVTSGRPAELPGVESMVGLFINTLPVRVAVPRDEPASAWLARLQTEQLEARQHQWTPLTRVQALAETPDGEPLFSSLLVFENYRVDPGLSAGLGELRITDAAVSEHTNYPLTLIVVSGGDLAFRLVSDRRFEPATAYRLLAHLDNLLAALAADPERPPESLPLLAAAERQQLSVEWNDTVVTFPDASSIPALFAEQAALRRDDVAVERGDERLTYGEVQQRAERLARRLRALGVRLGEPVAILTERTLDLIPSMLGILQAGGAYLPLDPAYPLDRLTWMIRDTDATILVAGAVSEMELPAGLRLVSADGEPPEARGELPAVPAEALAYVMYTSGSTGTPKGIAVSHRSVARLVRGADFVDMGEDQVWLQYSSLAFDASTLEIWAPLLNGGRVVLFPGRIGSLDELARVIADHGVTSAWLTAGLFHEMVDGCLEGLRPLRQLLTGGDVVSPEHARKVLESLPGLVLVNGYGPTENTTFTSCHRMTDPRQVGESVAIGRPIANSRVYVLDPDLRAMPVGVWGELYAAGDGLATCYLERPDLTAERFLPDPFAAGSRLYRTGDRVRWRADGTLEFLGRLDSQLKIRGFRVEPAEAEAALLAAPGVQRAAVVGIGPAGGKRLAAYWVGDATEAELCRWLRSRLPEPLVPSLFVRLPDLPLTPNGKVDRRALAALDAGAAARPQERLAPRTPLEETLVAAWAEVLGRAPGEIGVRDNFFALGGHSLLATRLVSLLQARWGIAVTLQAVFDAEHLAALADHVVDRELAAAAATDEELLAGLLAEMEEGGP